LKALMDKGVFRLIRDKDLPKGAKVIPVIWVLKYKPADPKDATSEGLVGKPITEVHEQIDLRG
jgi:hypothetical protein